MENYKNRNWLEYQYKELGKHQTKIAEEENVSQKTISKWINRFGIEAGRKGGNRWKGGRILRKGYLYIFTPNHPSSECFDYVKQARLNMEKKLGRYLTPQEIVHHRDLDKLNDNIDNLEIMSQSEHIKLHNKIRISTSF